MTERAEMRWRWWPNQRPTKAMQQALDRWDARERFERDRICSPMIPQCDDLNYCGECGQIGPTDDTNDLCATCASQIERGEHKEKTDV